MKRSAAIATADTAAGRSFGRRADLQPNEAAPVARQRVTSEPAPAAEAVSPPTKGEASLSDVLSTLGPANEPAAPKIERAPRPAATPVIEATARVSRGNLDDARRKVQPLLMDFMDIAMAARLSTDDLMNELSDIVPEICSGQNLQLNVAEQRDLVQLLYNDMVGLGPIEPLLADDSISEIMINGPSQIYIERGGLIQLTDIRYESNAHLMNAATRIVTRIGRRVDESSPICDARLSDGSRVNVIIPPLALRGPTITIRKFKKDKLTLDKLVDFGTITAAGAEVLKIIGACRVNVLISGGTGSGKTTLLNTLTQFIDPRERVITCEDAAELQLQQPHWVPLETRPANIEGLGAVSMRELVKNCLRMRPERIIVGEVRGPEAFDLLQAMNTGHDGSMGTLHANNPREAVSRLENMIAMAGLNIPAKAVREQISSALHVIVQVQRLRDGSRKVTHITEVLTAATEDVVTMQDLLTYEIEGEDSKGRLIGQHKFTGLRPALWDRARYFGMERRLAEALNYKTF